MERDLLNKLNNPSLDPESYGCAKCDMLKEMIIEPLTSCRVYLKQGHCPMTECLFGCGITCGPRKNPCYFTLFQKFLKFTRGTCAKS